MLSVKILLFVNVFPQIAVLLYKFRLYLQDYHSGPEGNPINFSFCQFFGFRGMFKAYYIPAWLRCVEKALKRAKIKLQNLGFESARAVGNNFIVYVYQWF